MTPRCPICRGVASRAEPHPEVDLFRCEECDHCFADLETMDRREVYDLAYGDEHHRNWFENPNTDLFEHLRGLLVADGSTRVLDMGCGRGDFLAHLARRHPTWELVGVEQTPFDPPDGVEVRTGDVDSVLAGDVSSFDAVVTLAVIEHVDDPLAFLDLATRVCRPGGLIVVMTLNDRSTLYGAARLLRGFGVSGPFEQLYSRHHLHHFNRRSLETAFEQAGIPVIRRHDHNIPMAAVDFPSAGAIADAVRRAGVRGCFAIGRATGACYLQTLVGRRPGAEGVSGAGPGRGRP